MEVPDGADREQDIWTLLLAAAGIIAATVWLGLALHRSTARSDFKTAYRQCVTTVTRPEACQRSLSFSWPVEHLWLTTIIVFAAALVVGRVYLFLRRSR